MDALPSLTAASALADALASGDAVLNGVRASSLAKCLADLRAHLRRPLLVVVAEPEGMLDLVGDLDLFGVSENVHPFPAWDVLPSETDRPEVETAAQRVAALRALIHTSPSSNPPWVVAPVSALLQPTLAPEALRKGVLRVAAGDELAPEALAAHLVDAGFESAAQVDGPGQFSRRGGILDVFPLFADKPVRLEFFGDEIDTVRHFDPATQTSGAPLPDPAVLIDVTRDSFRAAYDAGSRTGLLDLAPEDTVLVLVHPNRIAYVADLYPSGFPPEKNPLLTWEEVQRAAGDRTLLAAPELEDEEWPEEVWRAPTHLSRLDAGCASLERLEGGLDAALPELRRLAEAGNRVTVFCNNAAERQRLHEVLLEKGKALAARLELRLGHLSKGFLAKAEHWVAVGDQEIFGRYQLRRTPRKRYSGAPIADFTELRPGNYVVHVTNGIAKFEGIATLESGGTEQDYLSLLFAEDARVYVPLSHVDLVQRYVGSSDARPTLSKLGGKGWARRRKAAERAVQDIAADLLRIQAVRRAAPGIAFPPDDEMLHEFEASFPYEETPDQLAAVQDLKADQERASPMDRLLCGDVGFGKTEVAVRAAFKAVTAGFQAAVLVPTTILAEQHYRTFRERMADYPVVVGCLSRFRTGAEARRIVNGLKEGTVDIAIGTHRLLSKDVKFKNLGLAVIDEEQRFGVEHKEHLKSLRADLDILTMTATPIPRTLHMALLGIRDISNLATAPADRQAVRTMVVRYRDELVRRGVLRELSRGGQCYFVHNRVHNIHATADHLAEVIPEARFGVAHGQMPERDLLDVMTRFLEGKIDVLVTTTIIEAGVDIPTVNTLFVNNADHFGLSELHQLRGRVGRYRHQAYAYFLVPPKRPITPIARKRLLALEEFAELGAGFRIAMRDLEIRGAGNLLGAEQSGHIHNIGYDLYCKLLENAVAQMQGRTIEEREPVELDLGTKAFVPPDYIPADPQRVDFYRRLAAARDDEALDALRRYTRDRYGPSPAPVERLFADQALRIRAADAGLCFLGRLEDALVVGFAEGRGSTGLPRLRAMGRHVAPLTGGRWRLALKAEEREGDALLAVAEQAIRRIVTPLAEDEAAFRPHADRKAKPRRTKNDKPLPASSGDSPVEEHAPPPEERAAPRTEAVPPRGRPQSRASLETDARMADMINATPPPETDGTASGGKEEGASVLGLEPNEGLATVGAVVAEGDFDPRNFGPVTVVTGTGADATRQHLRYTGTAKAPPGRLCLTLRADGPEAVRSLVNAHLAAGGSRLLPGIVE